MHTNTPNCEACEAKLRQVHRDLVIFVRAVRGSHPDAHISCGYRGKADQEEAFNTGHSRAHYGQSAHNCLPSMAVDFFRLTQAGGASFDRPWFELVLAPVIKAAGLVWGGDWQSIKDFPHCEMKGFLPFKG